ncbi:BCCT family transporter [Photobacterium arenosum]|uniref:BCCT family transporter n=1 Tax=Photobacterium arenosum TaxID=2774143 RepID=UPI00288B5324|nr:BCCT family transporter [Photobacterium arenosum]
MEIKSDLNKPVFFTSAIFIAALSFIGVMWPQAMESYFKNIQGWIITQASWIYILAVAIFLIFLILVMFSRLGDIKLGPDHSEPDYSYSSWLAMLFSAGMGIGLMFFGVAEPVMHFTSPPVGDPQSVEAAREAMKITFFHWGLHAWGIYALVALAMAYFAYRHKLPLLPRSALYPILGDKIYGPIGHVIDIFAVIGTLFGVATSLGFGVMQVNAGFNYLFDMPQNTTVQVLLIAAITLIATVSVVLGLDGGIKRLSNINMFLAVLLLAVVIIAGPTALIMKSFVQNTGAYLSDIVNKTFNLYAYEPKEDWIGGWTLLYWGWWVSWSPFVGMFIARISRGRTIREFLVGVLLLPSLFGFLWFTAFGNTAIDAIMNHGATYLSQAVSENVPVALFKFFEHMPMSTVLSVIGVALVITFFVSSSDSGSLVIDTLTSGGAAEPPVWQRIFWAVIEGVVAAALLAAGGLSALQTMTIASAFPIMILMLLFCYCLFKALRNDYMLQNSIQTHNTSVQYTQASVSWKSRISAMVNHPKQDEAENFMTSTAIPALKNLVEEMKLQGLAVKLQVLDESRVRLVVEKEDVEDFAYGIRLRHFALPTYANESYDNYYRAEVFLLQGGQQYDVMGYNQEQIIADALTQYERHMHFLHLATSENIQEEPALS